MRLVEQKIGSNVILSVLEPRLVADKAQPFKEAVGRYYANGPISLALDLAKVEFIDSTGLGAILSILKRVGKSGDIIVTGTSDTVGSMFKLTRMDRVFQMFPTVDEALSARV